MHHPVHTIPVVHLQGGQEWDYPLRVRSKLLPVVIRQAVPGHRRAFVVGIVKAETQGNPVRPIVRQAFRIAESVRLLGFTTTITGRRILNEQCLVAIVVMLQTVLETQDVHHDHVGKQVENGHFRIVIKHGEEYSAPYQDHNDVPQHLVAPLRNDEGCEHSNEVQDHVVGRDIEPFE